LDPTQSFATSATGENKYVSREIGAANAGMQVKSAACANSWILATGITGVMSGAEDARVQQQVQRILHSIAGNK
jgi:hypothetical protein